MGLEAADDDRYRITPEDAHLIQAYQVCQAFHCLDLGIYRRNPAWWNAFCYAMLKTEHKAEADNLEEQSARARA